MNGDTKPDKEAQELAAQLGKRSISMKKAYLIGGVLGAVLCGLIAYAVISFIGMKDNETAQESVLRLPQPLPLEVAVPETRQPANEGQTDQGKAKEATQVPALSGNRKADERNEDTLTGVKITLKNGRSIIADSCRDVDGKLLCVVSGGSMQIDRRDIADTRDVKIERRALIDAPANDAVAGEQKKEEDKPAEKIRIEGDKGPARTVGGLTAEQTRRYDELEKTRAELATGREKLINDREELLQEVKDAGIIRSREKLDAIQQKIKALDQRIKGFNEQVNKLNEEIPTLSAEGQKKQ